MSFFIISWCFGADKTVTTAGKPLTVEEFPGEDDAHDDAYLEPTMFPNFYEDSSDDNPTCADYLMDGDTDPKLNKNNGTGKDRWTTTNVTAKNAGGFYPYQVTISKKNKDSSLIVNGDLNYSNCAKSKRTCNGSGYCKNVYFPCKEGEYNPDGSPQPSTEDLVEGDYQPIPGLSGTVKPAKGYRNITKIFVTWTVRLEGSARLVAVWPFICKAHHGTSSQKFPAGQLKTRLYVKSTTSGNGVKNADTGYFVEDEYVPVGQIAEMTVPSAGQGKVTNSGDPTITGSYALLPSDFANERVPPKVHFEVRWYNETSMRIKSPKNQRNLVVTVFPVTDQKE